MCFWNDCALLSFCMFTGRKHSICLGNDGELLCVHVDVLCGPCACVCTCVHVCIFVCIYVCVRGVARNLKRRGSTQNPILPTPDL